MSLELFTHWYKTYDFGFQAGYEKAIKIACEREERKRQRGGKAVAAKVGGLLSEIKTLKDKLASTERVLRAEQEQHRSMVNGRVAAAAMLGSCAVLETYIKQVKELLHGQNVQSPPCGV